MPYLFLLSGFIFALSCLDAQGTVQSLQVDQSRAIELALENSYDIRISRVAPVIQKNQIEQAQGAFDPDLHLDGKQFYRDGVGINGSAYQAGVGGRAHWGMDYDVGVESADLFSASDNKYNAHAASLGITLTQDLLRGFGFAENTTDIRIAEREHDRTKWGVRQDALDLVYEVIEAYNDFFVARKNLDVAIKSRDLASQLVEDNKKRIAQGVMAAADLAEAEAELARREDRRLQFESIRVARENRLKQYLFSSYRQAIDTELEILGIAPVFQDELNETGQFEQMLKSNTELRIQQIVVEIDQINVRHARNQSLPRLALTGHAGLLGVGNSINDGWNRLGSNPGQIASIGLRLDYPVRNRTARAGEAIAVLREDRSRMELDRLKQQILLRLDSALAEVRTSLQRIEFSRRAREFSEITLNAELKKLQAGTSSTFVVLRLQNDLATAEVRELLVLANYHKSRAAYARIKGTLIQ